METTAAAGVRGGELKSLPEQICDHIRELIIADELEPGSWLRERDLAQRLDVSRIPVREALLMLETEGFVRLVPRRGAMVSTLTLSEAENLFDVREALEVQAARLAARRLGAGVKTSLLDHMARAEAAAEAGDRLALEAANAAFHHEVLALSGNPILESLMRSIAGRVRWLFRKLPSRDPASQLAKHRELCDAIASGNPDLAAAVAFAQISRSRINAMKVLRPLLKED
ncbi:GntR family transcriptional regulator [Actinocorallia sp. A-T 12471]|uniref:GntR family transcriptional regulator n=1 Tax=Actinocorallia sp. A-T 12471 TaxID=3089813 RepID=UPI0029CD6185|nr:GntR family transcriptional regulator [Actinocorallia sp. A-T 12471]MDX6740797.1 GntR family transcriptional regulator [Actinocorallia sp. A-T 12471]